MLRRLSSKLVTLILVVTREPAVLGETDVLFLPASVLYVCLCVCVSVWPHKNCKKATDLELT